MNSLAFVMMSRKPRLSPGYSALDATRPDPFARRHQTRSVRATPPDQIRALDATRSVDNDDCGIEKKETYEKMYTTRTTLLFETSLTYKTRTWIVAPLRSMPPTAPYTPMGSCAQDTRTRPWLNRSSRNSRYRFPTMSGDLDSLQEESWTTNRCPEIWIRFQRRAVSKVRYTYKPFILD